MSTITEVQRILGVMNSREIEVLKRLVTAQISLSDTSYMRGIYLPSLEERLQRAMQTASLVERPATGTGEIDMKNENGVDYKIIFKSTHRVSVIKLLRELWNYGLKEAKDISDLAWDDRFPENTLIVRNDTNFNRVNARAILEYHMEQHRRLSPGSNTEPFARIEAVVQEVPQ
jgi:hypothetical protein